MTGTPGPCHPETVHPDPAHQAEASKIAAELAAIAATGMVLPGSITQRRTRCGRRNCGCHADPPRLHGPYWQWTRKIAAKTICRWLSADQHRDYQAWIDNDRRLRELLTRLEALGAAAFDADPRWERQARRPASRTGNPPPDSVGSARLTCGRTSAQPSYAQLKAKREHLSTYGPAVTRHFRPSPLRRPPRQTARAAQMSPICPLRAGRPATSWHPRGGHRGPLS